MYGVNLKNNRIFEKVGPNACYIFYHSPMPSNWRLAILQEKAAYQRRHAHVWGRVAANLNLASIAFKKFKVPYHRWDEIRSDVVIPVLLNCVEKHDPTRTKFSTYATHALINRIGDYLKSPPQPLIEPGAYYDVIEEDWSEFLNPRELQLIKMRFWDDMSFEEIGDELGYTRQRASIQIRQILEKLHAILGANSFDVGLREQGRRSLGATEGDARICS